MAMNHMGPPKNIWDAESKKKKLFAEYLQENSRQRDTLPSAQILALGKLSFVECFLVGTRQSEGLPSADPRHSAKCIFAECPTKSTRHLCIFP